MKKFLTAMEILVLAAALAVLMSPGTPKERTLNEILPINPINCIESPVVFIAPGEAEYVTLPERQCNDLFYALNQMSYTLSGKVSAIDNYGCIRFFADGKNIELLFSDTHDGSILINDVDTDGKEPVYAVSCGADALKELFLAAVPSK